MEPARKERVQDCAIGRGWSFTIKVFTTEDYGVIDTRDEAIDKAKRRIEPRLEAQIPEANGDMDDWLARQTCPRHCVPTQTRTPATFPPKWTVTNVGSDRVQVVGIIVARADADCD